MNTVPVETNESGIEPEDVEFDRQLEGDPRFAVVIAAARERIRQGQGVRLEDIVFDDCQ